MTEPETPEEILASWCDRDLTEAAMADELAPAYAVESVVQELEGLLAAGRSLVLVGDAGVGKTAIVHELVRRSIARASARGTSLPRFVQFSLRHRASALNKPPRQMGPEMQKLCRALLEVQPPVVPFLRDFDQVFLYDLEPQILSLLHRLQGSLMAEGRRDVVDAIMEATGELEQHLILIPVLEPSLSTVSVMLHRWNERNGSRFEEAALDTAITLTNRFLARTRFPRKAFDFLAPVLHLHEGGGSIGEAEVIQRFSASHRVPRQLVDPSIPLDLSRLEMEFNEKVLGQEEAINTIVKTIGLIKAGLSDSRRPFGVFLFVGPTGVGKTHAAQLLAEYLFGSRERLVRFNMADYQSEQAALTLFGNPDSFGLQRRGVLTVRLMGHPFCVLLLDEFEKAHRTVHDRFLQLVDEGGFINGNGETIQCRSLILIATSNAGAELYRGERFGFGDGGGGRDLTKDVNRALLKQFRFEFLNRFDRVVHFRPLRRDHIRVIAERELGLLQERSGIRQRGLEVAVDDSVLDWLTVRGYHPDYGARFLRRLIEREVTSTLAEAIVRESARAGSRIELGIRGRRVFARVAETGSAPDATPGIEGTGAKKRPERRAVVEEAEKLLQSSEPLLAALARKRAERARLLDRMNEPDFWERRAENEGAIERFRELDVDVRAESRLARPIERIQSLWQRRGKAPLGAELASFSRELPQAASALLLWQQRLSHEGPRALWLIFQSVDLFRRAEGWMRDLVEMERRWCRRRHLEPEVVACALAGDKLDRVAMAVEGRGASELLSMEEGVHRLGVARGGDLKVCVRLVPKLPLVGEHPPVSRMRKSRTVLGMSAFFRGRLELAERGKVVEWLGAEEQILSEFLAHLARDAAGVEPETPEPARVYAKDGAGAVDPRTGARHPRLKDVLKGDLEPFLEAWRHRAKEEGA
jgi:MoxR-like ATPase